MHAVGGFCDTLWVFSLLLISSAQRMHSTDTRAPPAFLVLSLLNSVLFAFPMFYPGSPTAEQIFQIMNLQRAAMVKSPVGFLFSLADKHKQSYDAIIAISSVILILSLTMHQLFSALSRYIFPGEKLEKESVENRPSNSVGKSLLGLAVVFLVATALSLEVRVPTTYAETARLIKDFLPYRFGLLSLAESVALINEDHLMFKNNQATQMGHALLFRFFACASFLLSELAENSVVTPSSFDYEALAGIGFLKQSYLNILFMQVLLLVWWMSTRYSRYHPTLVVFTVVLFALASTLIVDPRILNVVHLKDSDLQSTMTQFAIISVGVTGLLGGMITMGSAMTVFAILAKLHPMAFE